MRQSLRVTISPIGAMNVALVQAASRDGNGTVRGFDVPLESYSISEADVN